MLQYAALKCIKIVYLNVYIIATNVIYGYNYYSVAI